MYNAKGIGVERCTLRSRDLAPSPEVLRVSTYPPPHLPEVPIGGSVYQQPGTRVDKILSQQGGFQVSKGE
jgi:hypothetical protein